MDEAQAGIKIARTNINNLRYADDTTLMAESEEELKILLMKVKVKSPSHVQLLVTPWTAAYQAPPSMEFPRQEYWSGVPLGRRNENHNHRKQTKLITWTTALSNSMKL